MPEISKEEYEKFKEIIRKQELIEKGEKLNREAYLKKLEYHKNKILKQYASYGDQEAYALTFAKFLSDYMRVNDVDFYLNSWSKMQEYLTKACLTMNSEGLIALKRSFRKNLRKKGFRILLNRKYDTFKVFKIKPIKTIKK